MTASTVQPEQPCIITLTEEELATKSVGPRTLQAALEALHQNGLVVLENAVNPAELDRLNERMLVDAHKLAARKGAHVNFGAATRNYQQDPVRDEGYIFDDVVANPWAAEIMEHFLGPSPKVRFYSANTAFKAEARQPVHIDVAKGFPQVPFGLCVNINLVPTSPENGATEFWLGTHNDPELGALTINGHGDDGPDDVAGEEKKVERAMEMARPSDYADALVEKRRKVRPPIQATLPKGALIIRDIRIWHAGMPNRTDDVRIMLVTVIFAAWYRNENKIPMPVRWKDNINWGRLVPCIDWKENDWDYLTGSHDHSLDQLP